MKHNDTQILEYYFRDIGVRQVYVIAIFSILEDYTPLKGPKQTNGLTEYLFPQGTPVNLEYRINL